MTTVRTLNELENPSLHLSKSGFDYFEYSISTVPGIVVGGGLYGLFSVLCFGLIAAIYSGALIQDPVNCLLMIFPLIIGAFVGFLMGVCLSWLSSVVSCLVLNVVCCSFGNPVSPKTLVSCIGGASGFWLLVMPWLAGHSYPFSGDTPFLIYLTGPVLATLFGQSGAKASFASCLMISISPLGGVYHSVRWRLAVVFCLRLQGCLF